MTIGSKPAAQLRSRDKRDRILKAMESLLRRKPFAQISVSELAREADVAPATLYQRFSNEDVLGAILLALYFTRTPQWAQLPRGTEDQAESTLPSRLRQMAGNAWDQVVQTGHVMRPAYLYSRQHPERTGEEWTRLEKVARDGFRAFVRARADALEIADPDRAGDTLCDLFNFMLLGPLLHPESARWRARRAREDFVDELATLAYRYLAGNGFQA